MQAEICRTVRVSRHALLMGAAAGALAFGALALPGQALAANECGAITAGTPDTVACFGNIAYPSGITYTDASANDLSVFIFGQTGIIPPVSVNSSGNGVSISDTAGHNVTVTTYAGTSITAAGAYGIFATTNGAGDASIVSASTVNGATAFGVSARASGTGNATVVNSGAVTTASGATDALQAMTIGSGTATVVNSGALSGARYGVWAGSLSAGNATVVNSAAVGATYRGLEASSLAGTGSVAIVNSGAVAVSGSGNGFALYGDAVGGSVAIVNSGALSSTHSGIFAHTGGTGNISVVDSAGVSAAYDGIVATTSGNGSIGIVLGNTTNNANITATTHHGIFTTGYGTIQVVDHGTVTAGLSGIVVEGLGAGPGVMDVVSYGQVDATLDGIFVSSSQTGGIAVVEKGGITGNTSYGIRAWDSAASGDTDVVVTGAVGSSGNRVGAIGVEALQLGSGSGNVSVTGAGNIYGTSGGILAASNGSGFVEVAVSGNIVTPNGAGILGQSTGTGAVEVVSHGVVHGGSSGIFGNITNAASSASVVVENYGRAYGTQAVYARSVGSGNVTALNVAGSYSHGNHGILAVSGGAGAVNAVNNGEISNSAYGMTGDTSGTGAVTVTNSGHIDGTSTTGMAVINFNGANASLMSAINTGQTEGSRFAIAVYNHDAAGMNVVENTGRAVGGTAGVYAWGAAPSFVNNTGVVAATSGQAVWTTAPTMLNNYNLGHLYGFVTLGGNSVINNSAVWQIYGASSFGAGTNVINNTGAGGEIHVDSFAPALVIINNLTTVNNSAMIDMRNGHAGDVLVFGTGGVATFNGNSGSRFGFDANLDAGLQTDVMVIGASNGSTTVTLNDSDPAGASALNFVGAGVITTLGGSGTFNMPTYHKGFVDYELVKSGFDWFLIGAPAANAFEMLKLPSMGQDFWRRTGDVWSAREQEVRDSGRQPGWEMWAEAFGGAQHDTRPSQTFTVGGMSFSPNLGTNEDYRGFQMGGDQLTASHWLWGFTGGYMDQNGRFRALQPVTGTGGAVVHDDIDLTGWNVGVYGGWNSGGFFLNGLIKGDWLSADVNMVSAGSRRDVDANSWGAKGEIGFRFGGSGFYMEPVADIDWVSTHIDGVTMSGATFNFPDSSSSKGEIGARVGGTWGSIAPYLGLYAVDQWSGNNKMTMLTGAGCPSCMSIEDTSPGTYGKADFGFTILNWNGLQGFLKGEALFGNHTEGYAGRLGVRWRW